VFIIAEIGNNHEGDIGYAREAIAAASAAGADAVKFQAINGRRLVNVRERPQRVKTLRRFEFSVAQYQDLYTYAQDHKVKFGLSFFDTAMCREMEVVDFAKIASSDHDNSRLIRAVLDRYPRVIISTGMMSEASAKILYQAIINRKDVILMHCVSIYPTEPADASLSLITSLAESGHALGYSDHTDDINISLMALAKGCRYFEKHFTLEKTGGTLRDHSLSSTPEEFKNYCTVLRKYEEACKEISFSQRPEFQSDLFLESRQSVYLTKNLPAGHIINEDDVSLQRPRLRNGFDSLEDVIGRKLRRPIGLERIICAEDVE
jgi:sialic acid synthase SpsE